MSAADLDAIALVLGTRHQIALPGKRRRVCRCEECRAVARVCELARRAVGVKAGKRRRALEGGA